MAWHVVQGRRRPFPAGPGRANRQRAEARLLSHRSGSSLRPEPECRMGSITGAGGHGSLPCRPRRTGLAPFTASGPGKPIGTRKPHPRNGRDRGLGGRLMSSPHPAGRAAGSPCCRGRGRCGPGLPAAGVRQGDPAWKARWSSFRTICGRPAPLLSRAGSRAGPKAARSRQGSSSSPVCRPDGRVIAHPALPDVGGPGIAPQEGATGRPAAIPPGAGPVLASKAMTKRTGAAMRLARRRRRPGSAGVGGRDEAVSRTLASPRFVPEESRP